MNNKKGISAVVATVLIILITVAAVTIIWAAIIPMIKEQTVGGTTCLDAVSQVSIETAGGFTCFDDTNDEVEVQVGVGAADFVLEGVQIIVSKGGNTQSFDSTVTADGVGGAVPTVANTEGILTVPYSGTATDAPERVEIAPIIEVGSTQKVCDISSSAVLSACAP